MYSEETMDFEYPSDIEDWQDPHDWSEYIYGEYNYGDYTDQEESLNDYTPEEDRYYLYLNNSRY